MRDALVVVCLSASLAALVTSYLGTIYGLLFRPPRWRALVVLICPIALPAYALREGMRFRAVSFVVAAGVYAIAAWDAYRQQ